MRKENDNTITADELAARLRVKRNRVCGYVDDLGGYASSPWGFSV
jgi:hypothetical protein